MEVLEVIRKKSRAAAYCRFSSSNQREESIDAQLRAIYKFMGEHDYTPVGDYIDMALTGTNTDRPNFQRMIEDAKKYAKARGLKVYYVYGNLKQWQCKLVTPYRPEDFLSLIYCLYYIMTRDI